MMELPDPKDSKCLDHVRYDGEYYPFSPQFNQSLNLKLYEKAKADGVSENVINIIHLGDYFHNNFHLKFTAQLVSLHEKIGLTKNEFQELFIAFLNEQELINKMERDAFFNTTEQLTAFDIQNAVIVRKEIPGNPQNFVALSEGMIEFGNLFLGYLGFAKEYPPNVNRTESDVFKLLLEVFQLSNRYQAIKGHYDSCLFYNGRIEVLNAEKISFDCCVNDLRLINHLSITVMENQRLNRLHYYEFHFKQNGWLLETILNTLSPRILSQVSVQNGFIKYSLRRRTLEDCKSFMDFQVSTHDYYPFYSNEPLSKLCNLSISELLQLHTELSELASKLYYREFPEKNVNQIKKFKNNFLPRIKKNVLRGYLVSVTKFSKSQVEAFIQLMTADSLRNLDLFATQLLNGEDYYFFPYLPITHPNYLFLIDLWLTKAGENLATRGKALERYIKQELMSVKDKEFNKFEVIPKSNFVVSQDSKEEIDLLIQTKKTLIIGEIKCVKYPMYDRDLYRILADDIIKGVKQLVRKTKFLTVNQDHFRDTYSLDGREIVKVIILNFPAFTGVEMEGIPIVDCNSFLSYFKSGKLVARTFNEDGMEVVSETPYYSDEEEFCSNLKSYLVKNPLTKLYSEKLKVEESTYKLDGLPEIVFKDVNPIEEESKMYE